MIRFTFNVHGNLVRVGAQWNNRIKMEKKKNCNQNHKIRHAENIYNFRIRSHNGPPRRENPRACRGYQPEGKNPQIATKEEYTTCTGVHYKTRFSWWAAGREIPRSGISTKQKRERKTDQDECCRHQHSSLDGSEEHTPFRGRKTPG